MRQAHLPAFCPSGCITALTASLAKPYVVSTLLSERQTLRSLCRPYTGSFVAGCFSCDLCLAKNAAAATAHQAGLDYAATLDLQAKDNIAKLFSLTTGAASDPLSGTVKGLAIDARKVLFCPKASKPPPSLLLGLSGVASHLHDHHSDQCDKNKAITLKQYTRGSVSLSNLMQVWFP